MASVATTEHSQSSPAARAGTPTLVGWIPPGDLDTREWATAGRRLGLVGRRIQWLLGDWIAYGNEKFGERYSRASKITGYDTQTLMNMVYVASRFAFSRRREKLSWSHHETLAALDFDEQEHWLDEAERHRWSVSDLRMMLRLARREAGPQEGGEGGPEAGPAAVASNPVSVVRCPRCGEDVPLWPAEGG